MHKRIELSALVVLLSESLTLHWGEQTLKNQESDRYMLQTPAPSVQIQLTTIGHTQIMNSVPVSLIQDVCFTTYKHFDTLLWVQIKSYLLSFVCYSMPWLYTFHRSTSHEVLCASLAQHRTGGSICCTSRTEVQSHPCHMICTAPY